MHFQLVLFFVLETSVNEVTNICNLKFSELGMSEKFFVWKDRFSNIRKVSKRRKNLNHVLKVEHIFCVSTRNAIVAEAAYPAEWKICSSKCGSKNLRVQAKQ